ncbi:MAG: hypothetical protein ACI4J5_08055 [Oscillospiraceae bacterium]
MELSWCMDAQWCENRKCSMEKELNGCYECEPEGCRKGLPPVRSSCVVFLPLVI